MKQEKRKMKNKILKFITWLNVISFLTSVTLLDSMSYIPLIVALVNITWISLFILANRERLNDYE